MLLITLFIIKILARISVYKLLQYVFCCLYPAYYAYIYLTDSTKEHSKAINKFHVVPSNLEITLSVLLNKALTLLSLVDINLNPAPSFVEGIT